jgi:hypothetical protein
VKNYLLSGDFHAKDLPNGYPERHEVAGLWDADGDGALEIAVVLSCQRADGVLTTIYDLANGRVRVLGEAGFGA